MNTPSQDDAAADTGIWDCHTHLFGPYADHPLPPDAVYRPPAAPFPALRALHRSLGIGHGVLVQGACYGDDHDAVLTALDTTGAAYRGVALISPEVDEACLREMHARGIRGIRLGLMSHLGGKPDPARMVAQLERIRPYGWHALVHGEVGDVADALDVLLPHGVTLVIDHMARVDAARGVDYPAFAALERCLAQPGVWIKLSGADRITGGAAPYDAALPIARRLLAAAPDRAIWGTDWPHPNIAYPVPDERQLLAWMRGVCGDVFGNQAGADAVLRANPARLYA
jgi:predicted TIM-barrel fold metal-dependent hydrolase